MIKPKHSVRLGDPKTRLMTLAGLSALFLIGCTQDMSDLRNEVNQLKQRPGGEIEPIPEMKPMPSYAYMVPTEARTPFEPPKQPEDGADTSHLAPDTDRPPEPLEAFPLDALSMHGIISKDGIEYALIKDPEGIVHEITIGRYMGQNYGEVISLNEHRVELLEVIPDGQGGWRERITTISSRTGG
ncbi:MAG TPA: pilus assembly protein PilP [Halothiobacillaceae bacterium]|nr:pilus assembly protein PilP [Halothiobacillaceae bacterium]